MRLQIGQWYQFRPRGADNGMVQIVAIGAGVVSFSGCTFGPMRTAAFAKSLRGGAVRYLGVLKQRVGTDGRRYDQWE